MHIIQTYFFDVFTKHYVDFEGRATRTQFWLFKLFLGIVTLFIGFVLSFFGNLGSLIDYIILLGIFLPSLAISARRLNDIGYNGWWLLLLLVPLFGVIVLIIFFCLPSDD